MKTVRTIHDVRESLASRRTSGESVGFVPTMGALHDGHWSLVSRAREECAHVVVSIFVNPLQFGVDEDLDRYPANLDSDLEGCRQRGVDMVFCPSAAEMYRSAIKTSVHVSELTDRLCGRSRAGHFDGVCTVVAKLLNIVLPDRVYFGEKDYQQLLVVRKMVEDLSMGVDIVACPTCREDDGLAISSRNQNLSDDERRAAGAIYKSLQDAQASIDAGETSAGVVIEKITSYIARNGADRIDYVEVVDDATLEALPQIDRPARICVAAYFGKTRLIDNVAVHTQSL
ncbi:MAG: pantoate--beta-alanine ligase [Planctomycetes bacterium]|nr:pantoate--beta-alanine ligase [Planctomycetota bacterium]